MIAQTVGAFEAKTQFSRLLEGAVAGARCVITKHGHPVAELIPYSEERADRHLALVLDQFRAIRDEIARTPVADAATIRELRDEGRRR